MNQETLAELFFEEQEFDRIADEITELQEEKEKRQATKNLSLIAQDSEQIKSTYKRVA